MTYCVNCRSGTLKWLCGGNAFCSESCATNHWELCGGELDERKLLAVPVFELNTIPRIDGVNVKRLFRSETFLRKYVVSRPIEEWMSALYLWFQTKDIESLIKWTPKLLEFRIWDPNIPLVDPKTGARLTVLTYAIRIGNAEFVSQLLVRVDPGVSHNLALMLACRNGNLEIVNVLLADPRVNPNDRCNTDGEGLKTAIICAVEENRTDVLRSLLNDGRCDPTWNRQYALLYADSVGCVRLLLDDDRIVPVLEGFSTYEVFPWLVRACNHQNLPILEIYLRNARIMNRIRAGRFAGHSLFTESWYNKSYNIAERLLQTGLFRVGRDEMIKSCKDDDYRMVEILTRYGIDPFEYGFAIAVFQGSVQVVQRLLLDPGNPKDSTIFYRFFKTELKKESIETLFLLLDDEGFDPSIENHRALTTAIRYPTRTKAFKLFLEHPKVSTKEGLEMALEEARYCEKDDFVQIIQARMRMLDESIRKKPKIFTNSANRWVL